MNKKEIYQRPEMNVIYMEVEGVMAASGDPSEAKDPSGVGGFEASKKTSARFWESWE